MRVQGSWLGLVANGFSTRTRTYSRGGLIFVHTIPPNTHFHYYSHWSFLHLRMYSRLYTKWSPTRSGGGLITCLQSGHKVSSLNDLINEIWNVGCILISGGNYFLYVSLNTCYTMTNGPPTLDMKFLMRLLGKLKLFTFNNTFWPISYPTLYLPALTCSLQQFHGFSNNNLVFSKTCLHFLA